MSAKKLNLAQGWDRIDLSKFPKSQSPLRQVEPNVHQPLRRHLLLFPRLRHHIAASFTRK